MSSIRALRVFEEGDGVVSRVVELDAGELPAGDVVIRAAWSGLNYKDALTVTGTRRIMSALPMNAGIDVAGTVESSQDPRWQPGDEVLVTGCGLGDRSDGGYAELVRVPADWVIPLPRGFDARRAMAIGTAGFTAGMALVRMEQIGQEPSTGPLLVNGASGGVGGFAVRLFSRAGYSVSAVTGKTEAAEYLRSLGAAEVLDTSEIEYGTKPLEKTRWGGALDNLGGDMLAWLTRTVAPWGSIASVGRAAGTELNTTVLPFILRGVSLLGINSVQCARELRLAVWNRITELIGPEDCDAMVSEEIGLESVVDRANALLGRRVRGRILVRPNS